MTYLDGTDRNTPTASKVEALKKLIYGKCLHYHISGTIWSIDTRRIIEHESYYWFTCLLGMKGNYFG